MASQLINKVAIVTGSSSGLGEDIAVLFASRGAKVTICGRNEERLLSVFDQAVKVSGGHRDRFLTVQGDLKDPKARRDLITRTIEKFGRLDILVANAGVISPLCNVADATEDSYNNIMDTNVKSVFFIIQEALPHLISSKGNIITVSSMLSALVSTPNLVYPMSKAAIDHLTRCLAVDLGPKGIRVNSVNPSFIPTRILRLFDGDAEESAENWAKVEAKNQFLTPRLGTKKDVAEVTAFLASDAAGFVTGQHIKVDGGRSFGGPFGQYDHIE